MQEAQQEMTSVKAALLSFAMLSAIVLCGLGIYSADAANNHGIKRSRWRGLWRQRIQGWLIATVQNLRLLMRRVSQSPRKTEAKVQVQLTLLEQTSLKLLHCRHSVPIQHLILGSGKLTN